MKPMTTGASRCTFRCSIWDKEKLEQDLRPDFGPNLDLPRHGWFPFKEGFSASLVSYILAHKFKQSPGLLFDPFLGSGTTALEGSFWGWDAHGIEINPFLAFLSRVKTEKSYDAEYFYQIARKISVERIKKINFRLPINTTLVERKGLKKWLFNHSVVKRFEKLRSAIWQNNTSLKYKNLMLLCLIRAMQDVANAKRDGKCWRYKRGWKFRNYDAIDLENAFRRHAEQYAEDLQLVREIPGNATIHLGDSRRLSLIDPIFKHRAFDVVITSPPYLNSFDYTDIYRPELLLMGAFRTSEELRKLRLQTLRSHVQVAWTKPKTCPFPEVRRISQVIRGAQTWDRRIPEMVEAYFLDIDKIVAACTRLVKPGGYLCFVVSNSAYAGIVVPVDEILEQLFKRNGVYVLESRILRQRRGNGYHQKKSQEKLREVLLIGQVLR